MTPNGACEPTAGQAGGRGRPVDHGSGLLPATSEVSAAREVAPDRRIMGRGRNSLRASGGVGARSWPERSLRWIPEPEGAVELAAAVRTQAGGLGEDDPVLDLDPLLELGDFELAEADLAADRGGNEALMFPGPGRTLCIRVDPRPRSMGADAANRLSDQTRRHRTRFRVAHEIAHSFFYERSPHGARRRRAATPAEEAFCDSFASALLLPPGAIRKHPPAAASVLALARDFDVSVEVAARGVAGVFPDVDVAVAYRPRPNPEPDDRWVAQWVSTRLEANAEEACNCAARVGMDSAVPSGVRCSGAWGEVTTRESDTTPKQLVAVGRWLAS